MLTRRHFLARTGVLGAAAGAGVFTSVSAAPGPAAEASVVPGLVELLRPVLAELSRDTFNGLTAFVVPGRDAYSRAQGTPRSEPGGIAVRTPDFVIETVDNYVPFPQEIARPVVAGLMTAVSDLGIALPGSLAELLPLQVEALDDALRVILESDETIPLSLVVALLLNLPATQVNPLAVRGPFGSPFSRLSFAEKAETFSLLERADADLVAAVDTALPEPLRGSVSGLMRFLSGGLLEFAAFGAYNEWAVYDPATGRLRERPLGWKLTSYDGVSDGWDDFLGYYQDRKKVSD